MKTRLHLGDAFAARPFVLRHFALCPLAVLLPLLLAACNGSSDNTGTTTDPDPSDTETSSCVDNPMGDTDLYLRGGMNSWTADDDYKFSYVCDHFELVTADIEATESFKIADDAWSSTADFGGADSSQVALDTPLTLALQGSNLSFDFSGTNKVELDMSESTETPSLTIYQCPDAPLGDTALYLQGEMNDWSASNQYRFTYSCDAYYLNVDDSGEYSFKLADSSWAAATTYGAATSGTSLTYGEASSVVTDETQGGSSENLSFNFTGGNTVKLAMDSDGSNPTLTIGDETFTGTAENPVTDAVALSVTFDSRDLDHKSPFGAVTDGSTINYAVTAQEANGEVIDAMTLVVATHTLEGNQDSITNTDAVEVPMTKSTDEAGLETWTASHTFATKGVYSYYFTFTIGSETYVYENNEDTVYWTSEEGTDGVGEVAFLPSDSDDIRRYRQTVYLSDFQVPDWAQDAVYYQIFPERFRNGDSSNDPTTGVDTYLGGAVEFHSNWTDTPYLPGDGNSDDTYNNDFFGGDLQGIIDKLDYLADLGVNTLYINPIFEAGSNHKYDTGNYLQVDDNFGDNALFATLNATAKQKGIRVVLDTSLNHTGTDSVYFDRYSRYDTDGAFEGGAINTASPYYSWYTFYTDATEADDMYAGWLGESTLAELVETDDYKAFAYGNDDSVTKYWLDQGLSGWRMDVAPWVSDEFWRGWYSAVKTKDSDAVTVAETWFDASKFLLGDEFDATMNYIFHDAVLDFANGSDASTVYRNLEMVREHYPPQALHALMNLLSSHDVARALYNLGDEGSDTDAATVATAKQRFLLATLFQMTYPGAPSIYYGDEVGVTGGADPMNRGTYPWADQGGSPDTAMLAEMKSLIALRNDNAILRQGTLSAPLYSDEHVLVLLRELDDQKALVVLNNADTAQSLTLSLDSALAGTYQDLLGGDGVTVAADGSVSLTVPALYGQVLLNQ
ncbi:alpha-amylase family glycosyl hydrolase [Pseudaeromonas sp. ZJS20]|uniref:alpha-amylase family glycosyl hydrolase n=1 Tax=Pseudaeromonas aegiceratis TaxID=3153928 RepID=UPI00390CC36D